MDGLRVSEVNLIKKGKIVLSLALRIGSRISSSRRADAVTISVHGRLYHIILIFIRSLIDLFSSPRGKGRSCHISRSDDQKYTPF